MKTKIVEVTNGPRNWGKFMLCQFDQAEWQHASSVSGSKSVLRERGWGPQHLWVLDIETGEGFCIVPHGSATADLDKHKIWVCPMFEPFLKWLYQNFNEGVLGVPIDFDRIPAYIDLPKAPFFMYGHRRGGG